MAVTIVHALFSENKNKYGEVGDQLQRTTPDTVGEIRQGEWYKRTGGWDYYLASTDTVLAKDAAAWAVNIANNPSYGYSQGSGAKDGRWSGYKAIVADGIEQGKGNFDCSALVLSCYVLAGCPKLKPTGYTRNMGKYLMATGKFMKYTDKEHLENPALATIGGVYVAEGSHAAIVVDAALSYMYEPEPITPVLIPKEESGGYVLVTGSVWVRKQPHLNGTQMMVARKGYRLKYREKTVEDAEGNNWYEVDTEKGIGYISAFTKKEKKYTQLIL